VAGTCECGNETSVFGFHEMRGISRLAKKPASSLRRICNGENKVSVTILYHVHDVHNIKRRFDSE
jgi:hypothetical protein